MMLRSCSKGMLQRRENATVKGERLNETLAHEVTLNGFGQTNPCSEYNVQMHVHRIKLFLGFYKEVVDENMVQAMRKQSAKERGCQ